jgi:hypothetical protein
MHPTAADTPDSAPGVPAFAGVWPEPRHAARKTWFGQRTVHRMHPTAADTLLKVDKTVQAWSSAKERWIECTLLLLKVDKTVQAWSSAKERWIECTLLLLIHQTAPQESRLQPGCGRNRDMLPEKPGSAKERWIECTLLLLIHQTAPQESRLSPVHACRNRDMLPGKPGPVKERCIECTLLLLIHQTAPQESRLQPGCGRNRDMLPGKPGPAKERCIECTLLLLVGSGCCLMLSGRSVAKISRSLSIDTCGRSLLIPQFCVLRSAFSVLL